MPSCPEGHRVDLATATPDGEGLSCAPLRSYTSGVAKMLYTIEWHDGQPTFDSLSEHYGFQREELDEAFGIVPVDPEANLYSVMLEEEAVERMQGERPREAETLEGPYANPRIEPFDLQEPDT
jgi:hypothetical protein